MDRGPYSIECIHIINKVNVVFGWKVVTLFGNHEIVNMAGSAYRREFIKIDDLGGYPDLASRIRAVQPEGHFFPAMTSSFIAMARLAGPDRASSTLFVHGGVDINWINRRIQSTVRGSALVKRINDLFSHLVTSVEGLNDLEDTKLPTGFPRRPQEYYGYSPVWSRRLASDSEYIICGAELDELLDRFDVARIIVGHTPQMDRKFKSRCGGNIILADIAMSEWMKRGVGRYPVALVMTMDPTKPDKRQSLVPYAYTKRWWRSDYTIQEVGFHDPF